VPFVLDSRVHGAALARRGVDARAAIDEQLDEALVAGDHRALEAVVVVALQRAGAAQDEQHHRRDVPALRRLLQRGAAEVGLGIDVRALFEQPLDEERVPAAGGSVQGGFVALGCRLHGRALHVQAQRHLEVTARRARRRRAGRNPSPPCAPRPRDGR